jgi:ABC-type multidrug transport system fused ATPase/permease subunit
MSREKKSISTHKIKYKINQYIKLDNKDDYIELWGKIWWITMQSKPIIIFLIVTIIVDATLALIGVYNAIVSKSLIDAAIGGKTPEVIQWLIVMMSIMIGQIVVSPILSLMSTRASNKLNQGMQSRLYKHITYSEWIEQSKFHSVSLLTRITSDVGTISSTILGTIPNIISLLVTFIASFSTLIYFAPSVAMVALVVSPLLLLISKAFGSKLKIIYKEIQEEDIKYRTFIQESIQNLTIVKTFCVEKFNINRLHIIQKNKYDLSMKNTKLGVLSGMSLGLCSSISYFTIFCWGALNISKGLGTYGTFTAMLQLYSNIQGPISGLANTLPSLIGCIAAAERLMEIESISLDINNRLPIYYNIQDPYITFKNVSFSYKKSKSIIENINFTIKPGEIVALVGPSGEGKTTLIRLILSLIHCDEGIITIGDHGSKSKDELILNVTHRELISYVPQGNTLFSGTIETNLRYGKNNATLAEIEDATKLACASNFIDELDEGLSTMIGEKGSGVSEGQAQRLSIARALLRKRPILILDEATSSLDVDTELNVLKSIKELDYNPICIIITHRSSALSMCDRIFKLEKCNLLELNPPSELETAIN